MDLLQLEHFLAVVQEGSFTRAAERVCRTQPAVSQSVKRLEEAVGVPLFARDMPELTLTEAGQTLVAYAKNMLKLRDSAMRQISELHSLSTGHLTIGAYESAAVYLLPGPLRSYFRHFPRIKVGIHRRPLDEIPRQVMDREIDIGFVNDETTFHGLKSVMIHADEMICIASPRHPLTTRSRVKVTDLATEPFVVHHLCSTTEQKILRLFEAHGTRCNIAAELWSFENVKHFVQQDIGLAIVPRVTVLQELSTGALVEVPVEGLDISRRTLMVFQERGYVSDCAQQFIDMVEQFNWQKWLPSPMAAVSPRRGAVKTIRRLEPVPHRRRRGA
jgi:DNA-binding transcriptional LysR family regulator